MARGFDILGAMGFGGGSSAVSQREQVAAHVAKLSRQGLVLQPVSDVSRGLARSFWGRAWLDHLNNQADFASRLEKGKALVRADAVIHLDVQPAVVFAKVSAGGVYTVTAKIGPLPGAQRASLIAACRPKIDAVDELLSGTMPPETANRLRSPTDGVLPWVRSMDIDCTCAEPKGLCRHAAAVLLGLACRFDERPELLFVLRQLDAFSLISANAPRTLPARSAPAATPAVVSEPAVAIAVAPPEPPKMAALTSAAPQPIELEEPVMPRTTAAPGAVAADPAQAKRTASEVKKARSAAKAAATQDLEPLIGKDGKPLTIEAVDLLFMDIPRSTFQNWVAEGALGPSGERGTYTLTARGERRIRTFCDAMKAKN